jgi:hypothetical protein
MHLPRTNKRHAQVGIDECGNNASLPKAPARFGACPWHADPTPTCPAASPPSIGNIARHPRVHHHLLLSLLSVRSFGVILLRFLSPSMTIAGYPSV